MELQLTFEGQIELASSLIAMSSADEVRSFLLGNRDVALLNHSRGAIQFLGGCETGSIVAHVPLSNEVLQMLRSDEEVLLATAHDADHRSLR